eukprot:TRINITY_DN27831_c0_g1_i1.p1 TRINITY_DN27831_c0_g1~~TRINITY_DN27831_c0_g1_i1.p1  ORF type:complete len:232 (+),score=36.65 TRINITY_DN27831_c0_g1_i1:106-801(+)
MAMGMESSEHTPTSSKCMTTPAGQQKPFTLHVQKISGESAIIDGLSATTLLRSIRAQAAEAFAMKVGLTRLCLGGKSFSHADLQKTLGELGVVDGAELTCVSMTGVVLASRAYAMTEFEVVGFNLSEAVQEEFGADASVADFGTLMQDANASSREEVVMFLDELGLKNARVLDGGSHISFGGRLYFCERHDGRVASTWLVHKTIHHNLLDLGSWNVGPMRVLVDLGPVTGA